MVSRDELRAMADATGLAASVVEKDYVLGWILRGIYQHPALRNAWIFKGGTCLKKCYFETYRFSEDLDFTLRNGAHLDEPSLQAAFREIAQSVYDESGLELQTNRTRFDLYQNPRDRTSCQGRLYYRSQYECVEPKSRKSHATTWLCPTAAKLARAVWVRSMTSRHSLGIGCL